MPKTKKRDFQKIKTKFLSPYRVGLLVVVALFGALLVKVIFAASTSISLVPAASSVNVGSTIAVTIRENSGTDTVNVVQANVMFDVAKLQYVGADFSTSAFGLEALTKIEGGSVQIARGTTAGTPAISGDRIVAVLTFKALSVGSTIIAFANDSMVVRSTDNTNILSVMNNTTLTLNDTSAPSVPSSVSASGVGLTNATISWAASTDNVGVTGYRVYRNGTQVATPSSTSYSDSGLSPGTTYTYTVSAVDAAANLSAQSAAFAVATLKDTSAPTVPGKPTSSVQTMSSATVTWTASTDNISVAGYRLYRNGTLVASPATTSATDTGLVPNTSYNYTVAAIDAAGNLSAQSAATAVKTLADSAAPSVPGSLSASATGKTVSLSWAASTDNVGVTGYILYRDGSQLATVATTSYKVENNTLGSHSFMVAAVDAAGNISNKSTAATVIVYDTGDVNHDSVVNALDLSTVLSNWGKTGATVSDVNQDNVVNALDLSIILSNYSR